MVDDKVHMLQLGLDDFEKSNYERNKIEYNKRMSSVRSTARKRAKQQVCYICEKPCSSFCNSHSVPQFCLRRIATDGKVYFSGIQKELPFLGDDTGVKEAGTFQIICRDCDSTVFQEYENPLSYEQIPTGVMLSQIAMKNYLHMIGKRNLEYELYSTMKEKLAGRADGLNSQLSVIKLDLMDYEAGYARAKIASQGNHNDWYYLCYYKQLEYVVPYAFQGIVDLISGFNDEIINDLYNMSADYHTQELHIAVFPLEEKSVILMFIDSRHKRYRKFYQQLNRLPVEEQLSVINYIILSYSENVFLSKSLGNNVFKNSKFLETCKKSNMAISQMPIESAIDAAIEAFSLSKHYECPNLLSKEYAIV